MSESAAGAGGADKAEPENGESKDDADKPTTSGCGIGCLGVIGLFVLFVVLMVFSGSGGGGAGSDSPGVQREGAKIACENMVKDQLKAPSTAEFSGVTATGSNPFTVQGSVDAENSFGAMIRSSWTCEVRLEGDMFRGRATIAD